VQARGRPTGREERPTSNSLLVVQVCVLEPRRSLVRQMRRPGERAAHWSELSTSTYERPAVRSHPNKGCVLWTADASSNATATSVSAGQPGCGAPRRNRTGDPILTMEPPGTAVRTAVSPGHARPWVPKLSALSTHSNAFSQCHLRIAEAALIIVSRPELASHEALLSACTSTRAMARFEHVSSVMPGREESTSDCLMINGYDCKLCRGSKSGRLRRCSDRRRSDGVLGSTLTLRGWSATAGAATPGKPPATSA
jgi:hypothetical protein